MTDEDWIKQERIFHEAIELGVEEREPFLREACSADPEQIPKIRSLIEAFEKKSGFLESAGFDAGLAVLGEQTPPPTLANSVIGQYEVGEKIGEGGMGEVYNAFDTKLNRRVALKFLSNSFIDNNIAKRQLIREAQSAAMLDHNNICSIYDIEHLDGHDFIVMQFIDGMTLAEVIKTSRIDRALLPKIVKQIIAAAAFAHSHGVIHRDLKPANIMIEPDGEITVLDFGLAKMVKPVPGKDGYSIASQNGLIIGTVPYMSPEQLRNERPDYQSDIFSIGVTLYEMISGKNPFARDCQVDTIAAVLSEEPPPLIEVDPRISTDMSEIVAKCLEKDKQKRFKSAAEILISLENASDRRKRIKSPIGRIRIIVAAALLFVILISVTAFLFLTTRASSSHTLAVLPFTIENSQPEYKYLADGIPQSIGEKLSNLAGIKVKNESFNATLQSENVDVQSVGKELQADAVLTGNIVNQDGGLVLLIYLIRTSDGDVIYKDQKKIDENDLTGLQQEFSEKIAEKLNSELSGADKNKLAQKDTIYPEAKQEYIRGRHVFEMQSRDALKIAIEHFEEATNIDPAYARAWTGLADAYALFSVPGHRGEIQPKEAAILAKAAAKKAMEIDDTLAEPYVSLGMVKLRYDWDWNGAENLLRGAIARKDDLAPAHMGLSNLLVLKNAYFESLEEAYKAKDISPYHVLPLLTIARTLYFQGDFQALDQHLTGALKKFPGHKRLNYFRSLEYLATGKNEEAAQILEKIYQDDPIYGGGPLGLAYGRMGQKDKALKILRELEEISRKPGADFVSGQEFAIIYLGLGDKDKVFESLNQACEEKFPAFPFVITDPIFIEIRGDARFEGLRKCAKL